MGEHKYYLVCIQGYDGDTISILSLTVEEYNAILKLSYTTKTKILFAEHMNNSQVLISCEGFETYMEAENFFYEKCFTEEGEYHFNFDIWVNPILIPDILS